ncbi:pyridoxal phosphate-dependent aminotransferase family protein [Flavobacteriaceae bacterium]|nr:pyridoxal phosphate-dependent aminotransferase family protein [Flavobacteriaceae bacterium]
MQKIPTSLALKLQERKDVNSLRVLTEQRNGVDFYSNDYVGIARNPQVAKDAITVLNKYGVLNGSTGSRLISGTHKLHTDVENYLSSFHKSKSALLYNSGYDANVGLFSSVLQKGDVVLYDELIHASVRDGIRLSNAKAFKFQHNNLKSLEDRIVKFKVTAVNVYVAVESVYSMDGDCCPLKELVALCTKYGVYVIVDEAHSNGVFGENGSGLVCELNLEDEIFARVHTFGKALGCHGAVVLGSSELKSYLINFSRSFIYTTAIPLHAVATILAAYQYLGNSNNRNQLLFNISYFRTQIKNSILQSSFIDSLSAIHCCLIPGVEKVKKTAQNLQEKDFILKPILSPTVKKGQERLRICLHAYNTKEQIDNLISNLILLHG